MAPRHPSRWPRKIFGNGRGYSFNDSNLQYAYRSKVPFRIYSKDDGKREQSFKVRNPTLANTGSPDHSDQTLSLAYHDQQVIGNTGGAADIENSSAFSI